MTSRSPEGPAPQPDFQEARTAVYDVMWKGPSLDEARIVLDTLSDAEIEIAQLRDKLDAKNRWLIEALKEIDRLAGKGL